MKQLTKVVIKDLLKDVATKKDFQTVSSRLSRVEKKMVTKRDMGKMKKELLTAIGNIAGNSPTLKMHTNLERRMTSLEASL